MLLQILRRALLAAAILPIAAVQASPFYDLETRNNIGLDARDVFVPPTTCDPLVVGATAATMGQVCVGISSGTLTVVYTVNPGWTINKVHVLVTTATPTSSQNVPGQFPYSSDKGTPPACTVSGDQKTATCSIPVQSSWRGCGQTLYIVTHADVTASDATQQTAWGKGTCYDSKGNCAKYWTFTEQCVCTLEIDFFPITYTTTSMTTITATSTSSFLTSTTVTYETSSTSTYTTSTTVTYLTSTTSEYSTTESSTSTTTSTSIYPLTTSFPPTTTTTTCVNPSATTITTTISTNLPQVAPV